MNLRSHLLTLVALVLLTAAGLKVHQMATGPLPGDGLFASRTFAAGVIAFESFLAAWLISAIQSGAARAVALCTFIAFAGVTGWMWSAGHASCGCGGAVKIHPSITFFIDLLLIALLLAAKPRRSKIKRNTLRTVAAAVCLLVGIPAAIWAARIHHSVVAEDVRLPVAGSVTILEPSRWTGKRMPLVEAIDKGSQLKQGEWTVVLYQHTCGHCREHLPKFAQFANTGRKVMLVELSPYGQGPAAIPLPPSQAVMARLDESREWFVTTPAVLNIKDGIVLEAAEGDAVIPPG